MLSKNSRPTFEIGGASYTGNEVKKSRSYRLRITWNPPDIDEKSEFITRKVKPSADGIVEWLPLSGLKRVFNSLPTTISVTVEHRRFLWIWRTLASYQVSCMANQNIEGKSHDADCKVISVSHNSAFCIDKINENLGLDLVITNNPGNLMQAAIIPTVPVDVEMGAQSHTAVVSMAHEISYQEPQDGDMPIPTLHPQVHPTHSANSTPDLIQVHLTSLPDGRITMAGQDHSHNPDAVALPAAVIAPLTSPPPQVPVLDVEAVAAVTMQADRTLISSPTSQFSDAADASLHQWSRIEPLVEDLNSAFPTAITAVKVFFKLGGLLAEIHPIARVVVGVLECAYIGKNVQPKFSKWLDRQPRGISPRD
ncbi:hypothetical protein DL93DRAFT_2102926 [Clavulina sp. PMI_390]|nr:hypothetical protein DL93DRAFT_2102926 [Clavulina sp. PMI_390]